MDEKTREAVMYALESIKDMADSIKNWAYNIELCIEYADKDAPEDIELQLDGIRSAVGDAYDVAYYGFDDIRDWFDHG